LTEAKTAHFTTAPDQVGFMAYDQGNAEEVRISIPSWREF
jgi:hypothetical protein